MNIFANKKIWKKIVILFFVIVLISCITPETVQASDDSGIGGTLMEPICSFLVWLGDGFINILHKLLIKQDLTLIQIDLNDGWTSFFKIFATVLVAVGVFALMAATGTWAVMAAIKAVGGIATMAAMSAIGSVVFLGIGGGAFAGALVYNADSWDNEVDIPIYSISPEEIFRGDIPIFDVNFFKPSEKTIEYNWLTETVLPSSDGFETLIENVPEKEVNTKLSEKTSGLSLTTIESGQEIKDKATTEGDESGTTTVKYYVISSDHAKKSGLSGTYMVRKTKMTYVKEAMYTITRNTDVPEQGIGSGGKVQALSSSLSQIISKWYRALLTIAVVGMMSVLVYIGIRIMISSASSQKAKYKQMLGDWFVGIILMFTMHYGMVFANLFVDDISDMLISVNPRVYFPTLQEKDGKIEEALTEAGFYITEDEDSYNAADPQYVLKTKEGDKTYFLMPTNLMGLLRYNLQANKDKSEAYIGWTILFLIMVIYLFAFTYTYMKRVVYMAFLTIIAPLVALTYPIDKANDGQAQGFNMWFKEYVFNLLLQPMHLLLYTILISTAVKLATENIIYSLVAIGFMVPAEKIVRQMFNFSKASTPGLFDGAAGAALTMSGLKWLAGHGPHAKGKDGKDDDSGKKFASTGRNSVKMSPGLGATAESVADTAQDAVSTAGSTVREATANTASAATSGARQAGGASAGSSRRRRITRDAARRANTPSQNSSTGANSGSTGTSSRPSSRWDRLMNTKGIRSIRAAGSVYKDGKKEQFKRNVANAKHIKALGRFGTRAVAMGTLGTAAIAAGVAAGGTGKVMQNVGIGAAGGYKLGGNLYDYGSEKFGDEGAIEAGRREYLGEEEYQKRQAEINQKVAMRDEKNIRKVQEEFELGRAEAKEKLETMIPFYYDNKITDIDEMIKMENVADKRTENLDKDEMGTEAYNQRRQQERKQAYVDNRLVKQYGLDSIKGKKKEQEVREQMAKDYNWSDEQIDAYMKSAHDYVKINNNLKTEGNQAQVNPQGTTTKRRPKLKDTTHKEREVKKATQPSSQNNGNAGGSSTIRTQI